MLISTRLATKDRCTKGREHEGLNLRSPKNCAIERIAAIKELLQRFSLGKLTRTDLKREVNRAFSQISYVNEEQRKEAQQEAFFLLDRYVKAEEDAKADRKFLPCPPMVINIMGEDVKVIPDAVVKEGDKIEVIKYKPKAPDIAQNGINKDTAVNTSLEVLALWLYGEKYALDPKDTVSAGYLFLGKSGKHESDEEFGALNPVSNSTAYRMLTMPAFEKRNVLSIYKDEWEEFLTGELCEDSNCTFCPFINACHYTPVPPLPVAKTKKHLTDIDLTPEQEGAINTPEGIFKVEAGAGSGKTLVMSLRTITLLSSGATPEQMLYITFTVNGAEELRQRIRFFVKDFGFDPETADKIKITTFNSFGQLVIEKKWQELGYTECPIVVDSITRKQMILKAVEGKHLDGVNYKNFEGMFGNGGFDVISKMFDKMKFYAVNEYNWETFKEQIPGINADWVEVFCKYDKDLFEHNFIEYNDQQRLLNVVLADDPYYIENEFHFAHIMVDEAQDTSTQEFELLKKLTDTKDFKSLMIVGDASQNIFESMRKTTIENMTNFDEIIGGEVSTFSLSENHRSTPEIVDIANKINENRLKKIGIPMHSGRKSGAPVEVYAFESQTTEYKYVADKIEHLIVDQEIKPEDIAFIAKDGNELKAMGKELTKRGIQSQLLTPESVVMNSRVVAAIAAAEYLEDDGNTLSAFDYLNTIMDGKLFEKDNVEIQDEIERLKAKTMALLAEKGKMDAYIDMLSALDEKDETFASFKARLGVFKTWDSLYDYLKAFKRFGGDEKYRRKAYAGNGVILTTVHSSKGLEWANVFVSVTKFAGRGAADESRRILFTAITRARDYLVITGVANKTGSDYLKEVFKGLEKPFQIILDENDLEKERRKERRDDVKKRIREATEDLRAKEAAKRATET